MNLDNYPTLRAFLLALGVGACILGVIGIVTVAANLMTARDTLSVLAGLTLSVVLSAGVVAVGIRAWRFLQEKERARNTTTPILAIALALTGASGCMTRVEPGWEGIRVHLVGTERGVDAYPIVTGRVFFNPITYEIHRFPTFLQRVIWTATDTEGSRDDESFTFRSSEGYSFNVDVGFGYSFIPGETPALFERYRRNAEEITDGPFRDVVREAFVEAGSAMEGLEILGEGITILNESVTELVRTALSGEVIVEYVNIVGQPRVDDRVEASINAVIEATQRANEAEETVRQREFEAQQRVAQARGDSLSRVIEAAGRAAAIQIEADALEEYGEAIIQMRAIERWNGTMPQYVGGGQMPFLTIPTR